MFQIHVECSTQNPSSITPNDTQPTTTQSSPDPTESPVVTSDAPITENAERFTTTITDVRQGS